VAEQSAIFDVFLACEAAIRRGELIRRVSRQDKEFHFQNWFEKRLKELRLPFDTSGRNTYPDFRLVKPAEGFEVKGLRYPGREANYDSNSQIPTGFHNGRSIYYVFGRYPTDQEDEREYPVIDLVICHGDFLNADHDYVHQNKNVKGFGTYGDIMIRDRKMYVAPTPFALLEGATAQRTLLLPADQRVDKRLVSVGKIERIEADQLVVGYNFDLRKNILRPEFAPNPGAGQAHRFVAYRAVGTEGPPVKLKALATDSGEDDE
jgi:hypothetical protein